ncbi:hypothetical protein SNE40_012537 [Patella caerulea]|uniref:Hepatocyte growth factor-regulated tyrosine kinase substrate n=1 Tax=Patella caerulea TaxID=87958 RepID=A0AAN8JUM8_PATCE
MFKSPFDKTLEKATSQLLLEPDWDSILQICDSIRQKDVTAKIALASIKKKISVDNPHVAMYALQVLESVVKNCGNSVHEEVATKEYMEFLKDQAKARNDPVKGKILELVQAWSHAFRNEPNYKVVQDTFHLMKMEGFKFPVLKEADAMFVAERAPEWKDSDVCTRCRVQFSVVQRKHHCRACGEIYCHKCSSKTSIIPKYGIEREVRVCDSCYEKINKPAAGGKTTAEDGLPQEYLASPLSKQVQTPPAKSEQEIQEEEELQLALALSKSEHETSEKERNRMKTNYSSISKNERSSSPQSKSTNYSQSSNANVPMVDTADMDPELARYLNRNYWVQRSEETKAPTTTPSAPVVTSESISTSVRQSEVNVTSPPVVYQNGETDTDQSQFLHALSTSIQIFINRMQSNSIRGRSIANDSSVQSLFNVISNMNPQLMNYMQEQEELRSFYEGLQDKLAQLRDAREALDSLREEHQEKKRREAEELERQRQVQMAQKLEIMRQKKHEYLEMQRQMALQRLQEQEREMQMRFEQQRQLTQIRQYQSYGYPQQMYQGGPGQPQGMPQQMYAPGQGQPQPLPDHIQGGPGYTFSPNGSQEGSPVHQTGVYQQQQHPNMPPQNLPPESMQNTQAPGMYGHPQNMYQPQMMQQMPPGGQGLQHQQPPPGSHYSLQTDGGPNPHHMPPGYSGQMNPDPNMSAPQGYVGHPQNVDPSSFSMQKMSEALPQQPGQQPMYQNQPPQQHAGGMMNHPGQYSVPPGAPHQQMNAPPQQQSAPQGYQQAPQQPPPPQTQQEASLICFD